MARIKIDIPEPFLFQTTLSVRISDINYGLHMGHDTFISYLHEARVQFLSAHGWNEGDIEGRALVVSDLASVYKSQTFYADKMDIAISAGDPNPYGCDIFYRAHRTSDAALLLEAKTGIVFIDYTTGKVARMPEAFARVLGFRA